ncbi:type VII secretion system-associated protein [Amycolatopsis sp. lyj-109]|uniref:type VII secretion system-associated protein n=1 Tax=Amycolatopsis sp. lyj-109 TaxID=2789287 RepID=UPI00397BC0D4
MTAPSVPPEPSEPELAEPANEGNVLLLLDSAWVAAEDAQEAPIEVVLGALLMTGEGEPVRFVPNPDYRPSSPDSPLDPLDGALRRLGRGEGEPEHLAGALRYSTLTIAVDEQGIVLVEPAPDGVSVVLIASSPGHENHAKAAGWREVTLAELATALPATGVDVLINPASPVSMRFYADTIRDVVRLEGDERIRPARSARR